jgi:crotonobetainyl-CoA:carnitine CoA-transferase CaiB-like acyl-CoA transferase
VVTDTQWKVFCDAFGLQQFLSDPDLATNPQRVEQRSRTIPVITELFSRMTKGDLMARFEALGLPFAPIARPEDLFDDPHLNASGGLAPITLPDGTATKVPILPIEMDGRRLGVRLDLPKVGEHTRSILATVGYDDAEIDDLAAAGVIRTG